MKRFLIIVGLLFGLAGPGFADDVPINGITTADATAIHATVQAQLDAFAKDDADAAFDLATLEKRVLIGSPDNFMRLIRERYEPIYRNRLVIFFEPELVHGMPVQMVRVTDSYSRVWVAIFWMQQNDEFDWKIDGCHLVETASVSL